MEKKCLISTTAGRGYMKYLVNEQGNGEDKRINWASEKSKARIFDSEQEAAFYVINTWGYIAEWVNFETI